MSVPRGLDAVSEWASRIAAAPTIEAVFERTREAIEAFLAVDQFDVFVAEDGRLVARTRSGRTSARERFESIAEETLASSEPRLIADASQSDHLSVASVPLDDFGVLQVGTSGTDALTADDLALLTIFGSFASRAIDRTGDLETDCREPEKADRLYRTLVEQFPNGIVTLFDEERRYRLAGGTIFDELPISADDLEGRALEDVFPAEQAARVGPLYDRAFQGESGTVEVTLQDRTFRIHVVPVEDDDGEVIAGMTMSQDVTEQKAHEEELETARKRYQTLLRAAPDPIFVADANTGVLIEANAAAEELRGQPIEEIIGLHQTALHPAEDEDLYRELFAEPVPGGGPVRHLPDGSLVEAVTADGDSIPVAISVGLVELDETTAIYGIFRDISDQIEYERTLTGLNEASRSLFEATTTREIGAAVVDTVTDVLDCSGAAVYRYDDVDGVLAPSTHAFDLESLGRVDELPDIALGDGGVGRAYTEGRTTVVSDGWIEQVSGDSDHPYGSGVVVPLGDWGVLLIVDVDPEAFDDRAVDLIEILGMTAEVAFDRTEKESRIKDRERQLQQRTLRLEEVESLNAQIRNVTQAIVRAETRGEVEQAVASSLVNIDSFDFVWVGDSAPGSSLLDVRASVGDDRGYLEVASLDLDDESATNPALIAARTRDRVVVPNVAADAAQEPWRSEAIKRGYKSVMSIPLVYQGTFQGVLSIFSGRREAFSDEVQPVLTELGDLIAHALVALDRKKSLLSQQTVELEFDVRDEACFFLRFAQQTQCSLELQGVMPKPDESYLVFVTVEHGSPDELVEQAERSAAIESARIIDSDGQTRIQLRFIEPFIASILAEQGITLKSINADAAECRVTVAIPTTFDVRHVVDVVKSRYPNSELIGKHTSPASRTSDISLPRRYISELTPRQREVVELAYRSGYFETPKNTGAEALAEELDFSISAFHRHIRAAERKLFDVAFADAGSGNPDRTEG